MVYSFFFFCFIFKLYNIVLVLPYISMNPPQVYTCSPSWTLLPPPSLYHPSGLSQCTSPKHPVSCIKPGLVTRGLLFTTWTLESLYPGFISQLCYLLSVNDWTDLILNTNLPLLPSYWGFSFALGRGVSPHSHSSAYHLFSGLGHGVSPHSWSSEV